MAPNVPVKPDSPVSPESQEALDTLFAHIDELAQRAESDPAARQELDEVFRRLDSKKRATKSAMAKAANKAQSQENQNSTANFLAELSSSAGSNTYLDKESAPPREGQVLQASAQQWGVLESFRIQSHNVCFPNLRIDTPSQTLFVHNGGDQVIQIDLWFDEQGRPNDWNMVRREDLSPAKINPAQESSEDSAKGTRRVTRGLFARLLGKK